MRSIAFLALGIMTQSCSSSSPATATASDAGDIAADAAPIADVIDEPVDPMVDVVLVGNTVSGTVSFLDGHTLQSLGSVNVIPDLQDRLADIKADSGWSLVYMGILTAQTLKHFEPAGGQRFVDDVFVSPTGTTLYVSRSNLGDVAAFDLTKPDHPLLWRTVVEGYKADHAAISPDGTRLVVSATVANKADVFDAATGAMVGSFGTGEFPHQNDFSPDGLYIYNGSIGDVSLPYSQNAGKGARTITVADANTFQVTQTFTFKAGVRPTVYAADQKTFYMQQSYLNGLIEYDATTSTIVTTVTEPMTAFATTNYPTPDDYPHDSAHHGLAMSNDGTKLCDCGTIDNTISIVTTADMTVASTIDTGLIPYWATTTVDGSMCVVSLSGDNSMSVVGYADGQEKMRVPVGKFPQRSRLGRVPQSALSLLSMTPG